MRGLFVAIVSVLFSTISVLAQPLADRVPGDAVLYIGWRGSADPGPGFGSSNLKQIIDQSNFRAAMNDFLPRALKKIAQNDPKSAEAIDILSTVGGALWKYPTAFYFAGMDYSNPAGPTPMMAILCNAGAESKAVEARLTAALHKARQVPPQLELFSSQDIVGLTFGTDGKNASQSTLAGAAGFVEALKAVQSDPSLVVYADMERLLQVIDEGVSMADPRAAEKWTKARDALGLNGIRRIVCAAGFEGGDFATSAFVEAPGPRKGLLTLLDGKPLHDELLKTIPADASLAMGGACDLGGLISTLRTSMAEIDPQAAQMLDQGIGAVSMYIGRNLQTEILDPLGEHWVAYASPTIAGRGLLGMVVVNQPDDLKKAEQGVMSTMLALCNSINGQIPARTVQFRIERAKVGDLNVNYVAAPFITPAWASANGKLYFGMYPQSTAAAAKQGAGTSILDNPHFQALRKRGGEGKITGFKYVDLRSGAGDAYQIVLMLTRLGFGIGDIFGVKSPELIVPTLDVLLPHMTYAGGISWTDESGWHSRSVSPFPMASMLTGNDPSAVVGVVALQTSILLPSLNRARETANRVKCASNLRQMGMALLLYGNENKGKYPATDTDFYKYCLTEGEMGAEIFLCPSATSSLPADVKQMQPDELAAWIAENGNYVYCAGGKTTSADAETILIYERLDNHDNDGINMLYGDGHVEFNHRARAEEELRRAGVLGDADPQHAPPARPGDRAAPQGGGL